MSDLDALLLIAGPLHLALARTQPSRLRGSQRMCSSGLGPQAKRAGMNTKEGRGT